MIDADQKTISILYAHFRDVYKRRESQKMHIHHQKIGGLTTWIGASDERIWDAFLKGEQHEDALLKHMEELKAKENKK